MNYLGGSGETGKAYTLTVNQNKKDRKKNYFSCTKEFALSEFGARGRSQP